LLEATKRVKQNDFVLRKRAMEVCALAGGEEKGFLKKR
jgi:hypothetical protein